MAHLLQSNRSASSGLAVTDDGLLVWMLVVPVDVHSKSEPGLLERCVLGIWRCHHEDNRGGCVR